MGSGSTHTGSSRDAVVERSSSDADVDTGDGSVARAKSVALFVRVDFVLDGRRRDAVGVCLMNRPRGGSVERVARCRLHVAVCLRLGIHGVVCAALAGPERCVRNRRRDVDSFRICC